MFDDRLPKTADWSLVALTVLAFKHYYSVAGANELQWLLRPLAVLLESVSPLSFEALANGEWLDTRQQVRIVKGCAGGNFFIISLLGYLWSLPFRQRQMRRLIFAVLAAWLTTMCANGLRILLGVYAGAALADGLALGMADTHRLIGILSYFLSLCLQLNLGQRDKLTSLLAATAFYLSVTLCIPWLHGWAHGRYAIDLRHTLWVGGIPLGLTALFFWREKIAHLQPSMMLRCSAVGGCAALRIWSKITSRNSSGM